MGGTAWPGRVQTREVQACLSFPKPHLSLCTAIYALLEGQSVSVLYTPTYPQSAASYVTSQNDHFPREIKRTLALTLELRAQLDWLSRRFPTGGGGENPVYLLTPSAMEQQQSHPTSAAGASWGHLLPKTGVLPFQQESGWCTKVAEELSSSKKPLQTGVQGAAYPKSGSPTSTLSFGQYKAALKSLEPASVSGIHRATVGSSTQVI